MEIVVLKVRGDWTIMADGRARGRFDYQVDAEEAALRLAGRKGQDGEEVRILVRARTGELRPLTCRSA